MIGVPEKCLRGLDDCVPLAQIASDEKPLTFICCGENDGTTRTELQDIYRLCVVGCGGPDGNDQMQDCDRRDLTHQAAVIGMALAVISEDHD